MIDSPARLLVHFAASTLRSAFHMSSMNGESTLVGDENEERKPDPRALIKRSGRVPVGRVIEST